MLVDRVKALEDLEDALLIVRIDPDTLVGNRDHLLCPPVLGRNMDSRRLVSGVLDCVTQQVLEQLPQLTRVPFDTREVGSRNLGVALFDLNL